MLDLGLVPVEGTLLQRGQWNQQRKPGAIHHLTPNTVQSYVFLDQQLEGGSWTAFPPEESFGKNNQKPYAISQQSSSSYPDSQLSWGQMFSHKSCQTWELPCPEREEGKYTFKGHRLEGTQAPFSFQTQEEGHAGDSDLSLPGRPPEPHLSPKVYLLWGVEMSWQNMENNRTTTGQ